jgi:hypothetical protein
MYFLNPNSGLIRVGFASPAKRVGRSATDTSAPDRDSRRLGALTRLSAKADDLHESAEKQNRLDSPEYKKQQDSLFEEATRIVNSAVPRDGDDD